MTDMVTQRLLIMVSLAALTLLGATACGRNPDTSFEIEGWYRASVVDRESPDMRIFSEIHPEAREENIPTYAVLLKSGLSNSLSKTSQADCLLHVLVPHVQSWQLSGTVDQSYVTGIDPVIGQLLQERHDIPQTSDDVGNRKFEGTVFVIQAVADVPPLVAMWQVPGRMSIDDLRVGAAISCERKLRDFVWLTKGN